MRAAPGLAALDARQLGLSGPGLRAWARAGLAPPGAAHVSRSYREPFALVAWHQARVGVDIERIEGFDRAFAESICTPAELGRVRQRLVDDEFVASLWSSKEALAKALGDAVAHDPRRLDSPVGWADGRAGRWCAQRLEAVPPGHVAWLVWEEPSTSTGSG